MERDFGTTLSELPPLPTSSNNQILLRILLGIGFFSWSKERVL